MTGRRAVLKAGAGVALAGAGALGWRAWEQGVFSTGQGPAYDAWDHWNDGPADWPRGVVVVSATNGVADDGPPSDFLFKHRSRSGQSVTVTRSFGLKLGC